MTEFNVAKAIKKAKRTKSLVGVPNKRPDIETMVEHVVPFSGLCPISKNPLPDSSVSVRYAPQKWIIEVYSLRWYMDAFKGGRTMPDGTYIRDMEHVLQRLAEDAAAVVLVPVMVSGSLKIHPDQYMAMSAVGMPPGHVHDMFTFPGDALTG